MHKSRSTRRDFLKQAGLTGAAAALGARPVSGAAGPLVAGKLPASAPVPNRAPLALNAFDLLPLGSVRPAGWLRQQLLIQANGLGGHLDEIWADVGPGSGWLGGPGESWERGPYFLDGLFPLAVLLEDAALRAKAQRYIEWTLCSQSPDGMFGPKTNNDWWPRMVMLKVLTQYGEATGDPRVIPLMSRYFAYQRAELPARPLRDWGRFRWQDEALSVIWLFNRTGEPALLDLLRLLHTQGYNWDAEFQNFPYTGKATREFLELDRNGPGGKDNGLADRALATHGVNNAQALKASPVWSLLSHSAEDRAGLRRMLAALDRYHGLPNGMFSADEHLAGRNPSQGIELCAVVEAMFSLEQSLAILGDPALGDRLERLAFNALPGALTDDMWAHQYNQETNQVECSLHHQPWTTDGPESNLFGLEPNFGCCTANFHQGWPKFSASLWMASGGHTPGLVAAAYAPCEVHTVVAGVPLRLLEETEYPFRGTVRITLHPAAPHAFPLSLRIPGWAPGATLRVNGVPLSSPVPMAGTFARVERTWKAGDVVELEFPLVPRLSRWNNNSVALERGPLVFSFPIGEDWVKLRERARTADWQVFPSTPWNYALSIEDPERIAVRESPLGACPFSLWASPVQLAVRARQLPGWRAEDGVAAAPPVSPVTSNEPENTLTLVPYAAAKLRITAFPALQTGPALSTAVHAETVRDGGFEGRPATKVKS